MVGSAHIIADCLRRIGPEKDSAYIIQSRQERLRFCNGKLKMLGGDPVGNWWCVGERPDDNDRAMLPPARAGDPRARQR